MKSVTINKRLFAKPRIMKNLSFHFFSSLATAPVNEGHVADT